MVVIGAGVIGCAIAYELSKYQLTVAVLEQASDVAVGTSGRNSAVVHAGFNNKPGSLMARLCVEGSQGFEALCSELGVPYQKTGKYVVAFDNEDIGILERLIQQGTCNGVKGLRIANAEELQENIPNVGGICAMYSPETAIINPFLYTIALAETAVENGVRFYFEHRVETIRKSAGGYQVAQVDAKPAYPRLRGRVDGDSEELGCDLIQNKVLPFTGIDLETMYAYHLCHLSAVQSGTVDEILCLKGLTSRSHLVPTGAFTNGLHSVLKIETSAEYIEAPEDYASTSPVMDKLFTEAKQLLPALERRHIIGSYCGNRAKLAPPEEGGFRDFVIQEFPEAPGAIQLLGIESPGLTSSMPIACMVAGMLTEHEPLILKKKWNPRKRTKIRFHELPLAEQRRLVAEDPDYGEIICRCEQITKREIKDAIENLLGVRTISGIKYRCRATTGRCQGGYCLTRIADILIKEYGMSPDEITTRGGGSHLFDGFLREVGR